MVLFMMCDRLLSQVTGRTECIQFPTTSECQPSDQRSPQSQKARFSVRKMSRAMTGNVNYLTKAIQNISVSKLLKSEMH